MEDTPQKSNLGISLWVLAFVLMVVAAVYQRSTGPTHPLKGSISIDEQQIKYSLPRSAENTGAANISIPDVNKDARVLWRRYPTDAPFEPLFMAPETDRRGKKILTANIPPQKAAGKVEYKIEIGAPTLEATLPSDEETVVLRFKGTVSTPLLLSHILLIFAAMLISTRAGLGAALGRTENKLPWLAMGLVLLGGLVLGAFVQKSAFGAYWTGWPIASDWTDNKTLLMFLCWLVACLLNLARLPKTVKHLAILLASVLTLAAYVIPHSIRGSQYDYQQESVPSDQGR